MDIFNNKTTLLSLHLAKWYNEEKVFDFGSLGKVAEIFENQ